MWHGSGGLHCKPRADENYYTRRIASLEWRDRCGAFDQDGEQRAAEAGEETEQNEEDVAQEGRDTFAEIEEEQGQAEEEVAEENAETADDFAMDEEGAWQAEHADEEGDFDISELDCRDPNVVLVQAACVCSSRNS